METNPFYSWGDLQDQLNRIEGGISRVFRALSVILKKEGMEMTAIQDLNNAVTSLGNVIVDLDAAVQKEIAALVAAQAANNDAAVAQAASNIVAMTSKVAADATALTASIPAATTVTAPPPPVPPADLPPPNVTPPEVDPVAVTAPNATPPA